MVYNITRFINHLYHARLRELRSLPRSNPSEASLMSTPLSPLLSLAELDSYLDEGVCLISQAEERLLQLERDGACQGQLLMGAQILKAMRRNLRLIQERRNSLEKEVAVLPV